MLIAAKRLYGSSLEGTDGLVGTLKDLLFDGQSWKVRYIEVDTGRWLADRRVILSPSLVVAADHANRQLGVKLTKQQVDDSPSVRADLPVSRQHEIELSTYYGWGAYWACAEAAKRGSDAQGDPDLRSTRAVAGYHIQVLDGEVGHVDDFIVDDHAWEIRYVVIDTRNWLPGRHVLILPDWAESIDWETRKVQIGLSRKTIEDSPEYDPNQPVNRLYEEVFYDYYGRPKYWTSHAV